MIEFTLNFDTQPLAIPMYVQLYTYIKNEIISGRLEANSKLPSARKLSNHLNISRNTVNTAYSQLQAEGYLETIARSGYYVSHDIDEEFSSFLSDTFSSDEILHQNTSLKICRYDFKHGKIDSADFPNKILKKLLNHCLMYDNPNLATYGDVQGEYDLRSEIVKYIRNARGVKCTPEQIVLTSGTQHSLDLICKLMKDEYFEIAVEDPGYLGGRVIFELNGFKSIPIKLDSTGIDMELLHNSNANIVLVTPSHQFPNGIIMPVSKRVDLLRWAEENHGLIIENDYEGELNYFSKPIPCLQSFDSHGNVIYLYSFSNSLFPSIRTSFFVLPRRYLKKYRDVLGLLEQTVPTLIQRSLEMFLSEGHLERHVRKTKKAYSNKYAVLIDAIQNHMGQKVTIISNSAGLHVLLTVHNGMNENELIKKAKDQDIKVYPSSQYWLKKESKHDHSIMLGFGTMNTKEIIEGIRLLSKAWFN